MMSFSTIGKAADFSITAKILLEERHSIIITVHFVHYSFYHDWNFQYSPLCSIHNEDISHLITLMQTIHSTIRRHQIFNLLTFISWNSWFFFWFWTVMITTSLILPIDSPYYIYPCLSGPLCKNRWFFILNATVVTILDRRQ